MIIKKLKDWLFDDSISNLTGNEIGLLRIGLISAVLGMIDLSVIATLVEKAKGMERTIKFIFAVGGVSILIMVLVFLLLIAIFSLESFFDSPKK